MIHSLLHEQVDLALCSPSVILKTLTELKNLGESVKRFSAHNYEWESSLNRKLSYDEIYLAQGKLLRHLSLKNDYDITKSEKACLLNQITRELHETKTPEEAIQLREFVVNHSLLKRHRHTWRPLELFKSSKEPESIQKFEDYYQRHMENLLKDANEFALGLFNRP